MSLFKPSGNEVRQLVGNPDVYAVQDEDGGWKPVHSRLSPGVIAKHRAGTITVGTYIVIPPNQARTLVLDIDDENPSAQDTMLMKVKDVLASLQQDNPDLNWRVELSGRKGYHVWVLAEKPVDAALLYRIGRGVREEAGYPSMEVFPKQTTVEGRGKSLGNLVKLPGGVHRVTGTHNDFASPRPLLPVSVSTLEAIAKLYPESKARVVKRAGVEWPCVDSIQGGVPEGGRNIHLFHLAVMLRRASLHEEHVTTIVAQANQKCDPPLDDFELGQLLESSAMSGPLCGQLDESVHCGGNCMLERHAGLYTRAGALRYAQPGEMLVVEAADRSDEGRVIQLVHPDAVQIQSQLADKTKKGK